MSVTDWASEPVEESWSEYDDFGKYLTRELLTLDESDEEGSEEMAKNLAIKVKNMCHTQEKLSNVIDKLYDSCLDSGALAVNTSFLFASLSQLEVDGVKCRNLFLRKIQVDFARKDELRHESLEKYYNMVVLLCQIFLRVRVAGGITIAALTDPILDCLETLICQPDVDGLAVFCCQIGQLGPELKYAQDQRFAEVMNMLRTCVIEYPSFSKETSAGLIRILELNSKEWCIPEGVEAFYKRYVPIQYRRRPMKVSKALQNGEGAEEAMAKLNISGSTTVILPDLSVPPPNMDMFHHHHHQQQQPQQQQPQPQQQYPRFGERTNAAISPSFGTRGSGGFGGGGQANWHGNRSGGYPESHAVNYGRQRQLRDYPDSYPSGQNEERSFGRRDYSNFNNSNRGSGGWNEHPVERGDQYRQQQNNNSQQNYHSNEWPAPTNDRGPWSNGGSSSTNGRGTTNNNTSWNAGNSSASIGTWEDPNAQANESSRKGSSVGSEKSSGHWGDQQQQRRLDHRQQHQQHSNTQWGDANIPEMGSWGSNEQGAANRDGNWAEEPQTQSGGQWGRTEEAEDHHTQSRQWGKTEEVEERNTQSGAQWGTESNNAQLSKSVRPTWENEKSGDQVGEWGGKDAVVAEKKSPPSPVPNSSSGWENSSSGGGGNAEGWGELEKDSWQIPQSEGDLKSYDNWGSDLKQTSKAWGSDEKPGGGGSNWHDN